jgi:cation:H+ antiporter
LKQFECSEGPCPGASEKETAEAEEPILPGTMTMKKAVLGFAACAVAILFTGPFQADAAVTIADGPGLGKTFVGTTLVAVCTSLPELVSSIAALRLGVWDLAICQNERG